MKYREECNDVFNYYDEGYYLCQCLSADLVAGAGIAVLFNKKLDMKNKLLKRYPNGVYLNNGAFVPSCIYESNVFNLITKNKVWEKPTYETLKLSLDTMVLQLLLLKSKNINIDKIAMPLIGCGIDGLEWKKVREIVKESFKNTDIEIVVCFLEKDRNKVEVN